MADVTERINEAIDSGEVLLIKYAGGSQPGVPRRIVPIQILEGGKLRARCVATNAAKLFVLAKIEVMDSIDPSEPAYQVSDERQQFQNLHEALSSCRAQLEAAGWEIHERLELCKFDELEFRAVTDIELIHNTARAGIAIAIDESGKVSTEAVGLPKPWRLQCKSSRYSGSFTSLDSAIEKLLILATKPNPGDR